MPSEYVLYMTIDTSKSEAYIAEMQRRSDAGEVIDVTAVIEKAKSLVEVIRHDRGD